MTDFLMAHGPFLLLATGVTLFCLSVARKCPKQ
jgi:hypothetical protein